MSHDGDEPITYRNTAVNRSKSMQTIKIVAVGDGAVGKTALWDSHRKDGVLYQGPQTNLGTSYSSFATIGKKTYALTLEDTVGNESYDHLRPLTYPNTDVFLVCFSVVSPDSFENLEDIWIPEIKHFCSKTPFLLVGTKTDLREDAKTIADLARRKQTPVSQEEGENLAKKIKAVKYLECSAKTGEGVEEVVDKAILAALALSKQFKLKKKNKDGEKVKNEKKSEQREKEKGPKKRNKFAAFFVGNRAMATSEATHKESPESKATTKSDAITGSNTTPATETNPESEATTASETVPPSKGIQRSEESPSSDAIPASDTTTTPKTISESASPTYDSTSASKVTPASDVTSQPAISPRLNTVPASETILTSKETLASKAIPSSESTPESETYPVSEAVPTLQAIPVLQTTPGKEINPESETKTESKTNVGSKVSSKLQADDSNLEAPSSRNEPYSATLKKQIGPEGGMMMIGDCSLSIPQHSLKNAQVLTFSVSMYLHNLDLPDNQFPISPLINVKSVGEMQIPSVVKASTFFECENLKNGVNIYKRSENENGYTWNRWESEIKRGEGFIEFPIDNYCSFIATVPLWDWFTGQVNLVHALLYKDDSFLSIICKAKPKSLLNERMHLLEKRGYKIVHDDNFKMSTAEETREFVEMRSFLPDHYHFSPAVNILTPAILSKHDHFVTFTFLLHVEKPAPKVKFHYIVSGKDDVFSVSLTPPPSTDCNKDDLQKGEVKRQDRGAEGTSVDGQSSCFISGQGITVKIENSNLNVLGAGTSGPQTVDRTEDVDKKSRSGDPKGH